MSLALTLLKNSPVTAPDRMLLGVAASGSYTTGGDTLNLTPNTILDPKLIGVLGPNELPWDVSVKENNLSGYYAQIVPGTTLANWKIQFFAPGGSEVSATTYPSQISSGTLNIEVVLKNSDR